MDFNEFVTYAENYRKVHPSQRMGQAYFNALHEVHPDVANEIRTTAIDPFYNNSVMPQFAEFVAEKLG